MQSLFRHVMKTVTQTNKFLAGFAMAFSMGAISHPASATIVATEALGGTPIHVSIANANAPSIALPLYDINLNPVPSGNLTIPQPGGNAVAQIPGLSLDFTNNLLSIFNSQPNNLDVDITSLTPNAFQGIEFVQVAGSPISATQSATSFDLNIPAGTSNISVDAFAVVSAAPEPSTWTLMIAGIGAVGAALRSSRRKLPAPAPR